MEVFKTGPTEMKGEIWDEKGRFELVEILITHQQDFINSIRFTYRIDEDAYHSKTYGKPNGLKFNMVEIGYPNEVLTSVSGKYKDGRLVSIAFETNKKKFGPFGRTGCSSNSSLYEDFRYEFTAGRFGGFHESVDDGSMYAIGVYVKSYEVYTLDDFCEDLQMIFW
ncbi:hypothetical protein QVD17_15657 [Tagetes erecta]|uniref:Jacalin-type lectin domain-containing protein n=1 Tax=Tagetes erecta TaxID=13708 RepID=A0AAD8NSU0_TARER|nr:hypothetical protein QVD17_15657 [Tagetes erecta]